ncbi:hypothetical protein BU26DRAFT_244450 [Trematosphaeria pertusa]|uniref:Uncharacterized protein n=1 Tax=Trematosphaeria pertusa TaxID=390896 RepID=A0A6A6IMK3_9PLEO|nr:uncharacterized protein BU26DRAFT_244450 [Trematosphaeria pertusa]KAF2251795.1 hypothetical protein BU26DRAFT_244450 [Trematosphaeria pertusa]
MHLLLSEECLNLINMSYSLRHSPHRVAHAFVYTQQAPWSSIAYGLSRAISEPEEAFRQWADAQIVMNASIGLVGSIVSAVVASLLTYESTQASPWTASAALYAALTFSLMGIVSAFQQNIFVESALLRPTIREQANHIFGIVEHPEDKNHVAATVRRCAFALRIPELLLTCGIFCLFVGLSVVAISPLWDRGDASVWDGQQKIAVTYIIALFIGIVAYLLGIVSQIN